MKKYLIFLISIILIFALIIVIIKNYEISRANDYASLAESIMKKEPARFDIKQGVKVDKIIKATPAELIILINWGENEKAYVSIKNWIMKEHDHIEIYTLSMGIQE